MDAKLIEEIARLRPSSPMRPKGFGVTYQEYAQAQGMSRSMASRVLSELVSEGVLLRQYMICNGKRASVYSMAKK